MVLRKKIRINKLIAVFLTASIFCSFFLVQSVNASTTDEIKNKTPIPLELTNKEFEKLKHRLKNKNIPGGVALIPFNKGINQAYFEDRPILMITNEKKDTYALVGIGLHLDAGRYLIRTNHSPISFLVSSFHYQEQRIQLAEGKKKYITPAKKNLERIKSEAIRSNKVKNYFSPTPPESLSFIPPTEGTLTSPFGLKRFFNNVAKNPHNGIDYANQEGTKIVAANSGTVIDVHDYYFNGNSVFIDHGLGLVSVYIHLSEIKVKIGQKVKQGELIGLMGQTGRTTAANLHFGIYLNANAVNPHLFLLKADDQ